VPVIVRATSERDLYRRPPIDEIVVEHSDAMTDAAPLADQDGICARPPFRSGFECGLGTDRSNPIEDSLREGLETAESPLLKSVGGRPNHERPADMA
jgi:hypothetical protein